MINPDVATKKIEMNQYDYGVIFTFTLQDMVEGSYFKFSIYDENGTKFHKEIEPEENILSISLTKSESDLIEEGQYFWSLEQYVDGDVLHNTIFIDKTFKVVKGKNYGAN